MDTLILHFAITYSYIHPCLTTLTGLLGLFTLRYVKSIIKKAEKFIIRKFI